MPALRAAGHEVVDGRESGPEGCDAAVDFTRPDAVLENVGRCLAAGVPVVIGTTGFDVEAVRAAAEHAGVPCFQAPNFSQGAVLMMRLAEEAPRPSFPVPRSSSSTTRRSKTRRRGRPRRRPPAWGSTRSSTRCGCPGWSAHQEVVFGGAGEMLTIRHDTVSREAFAPGVLLALERVRSLPAGLTVGLDALS